jgi:hypothetical protein
MSKLFAAQVSYRSLCLNNNLNYTSILAQKNLMNVQHMEFNQDFFADISDLEKLVENNPASNFFIDEAPVSEENFPTEVLAQISKKVSPNNSLWIACQSDKPPYTENSILAGNLISTLYTFVFKCALVSRYHRYF